MKNPVVAASMLLIAAVGGIAALSQDIYLLKKNVICLPYEFGITRYKGTAMLATKAPVYEWKKISTISEDRTTKNHHCDSGCSDEPTRTNYKMSVDIPRSSEGNVRVLQNPNLKCLTPKRTCGGWNEVIDVRIVDDGQRATASFDVWTKPTTWRLSADLYERQVVDEIETLESLAFSDTKLLEISAPKTTSSIILRGAKSDGSAFSFDIGKLDIDKADHTGAFRLLRATPNPLDDSMHYVLEVSNPNCES